MTGRKPISGRRAVFGEGLLPLLVVAAILGPSAYVGMVPSGPIVAAMTAGLVVVLFRTASVRRSSEPAAPRKRRRKVAAR